MSSIPLQRRSPSWKWTVCGLLFLATMMMYMDRQTLAQMAKRICEELHLSNQQYGTLEKGFGLAFAVGAIVNGIIADRVSIRWLYPLMLLGWSVAGVATAWSVEIGQQLVAWFPALASDPAVATTQQITSDAAYAGLLACRITLGFFESGHWPCALITTQRLLAAEDRPLGNSVLQSGASIGAILTPLAVMALLTNEPGSWRSPFVIIGLAGMVWILPWLLVIRGKDLARATPTRSVSEGHADLSTHSGGISLLNARRFLVLLAVVIPINMTWQFFRAWLPKMLGEQHDYGETFIFWFTSGYYLMADAGCLAVGFAAKALTASGWRVHRARVLTFVICTALCTLSAAAAYLPAGPMLLGVLLLIGFGSLGLFPTFYSLTQEISSTHQGLITGALGFTTWVVTSYMQEYVGKSIDQTGSYATGLFWAGQVPIVACLALALFWGTSAAEKPMSAEEAHA